MRGRGHILCAGFCPRSPCKIPPTDRRYYQRQKDKIKRRTKPHPHGQAVRPFTLASVCRCRAPLRPFAFARSPLPFTFAHYTHPNTPQNPQPKQPTRTPTHTQKASRKTHPKRSKNRQKKGGLQARKKHAEKVALNPDTRITRARTRNAHPRAPARS